jgi:hypothetical protein
VPRSEPRPRGATASRPRSSFAPSACLKPDGSFAPALKTRRPSPRSPSDWGSGIWAGSPVKSIAIGLTDNTESVYASLSLDLKQTGPAVIEVPPKVLGVIDDGFMCYVADLGNPGPDRGQGRKYLLLPARIRGRRARRLLRHPTWIAPAALPGTKRSSALAPDQQQAGRTAGAA